MQKATSLMHASQIKMLLNLPLIILVLTIEIFRNVKTLIMLMLFLERPQVVVWRPEDGATCK